MQSYQINSARSFVRTIEFFTAHPDLLEPGKKQYNGPAVAAQVAALRNISARLADLEGRQVFERRQSTLLSKDESELKAQVANTMAAIARVARELRGVAPGIGLLRGGASGTARLAGAKLVVIARQLSREAKLYEGVLAEHGLEEDVVSQLDAAIAALVGSMEARAKAQREQISATSSLAKEIQLGRRTVRILDAALARSLAGSPELLAEWKHVSRPQAKARRSPDTGVDGAEVIDIKAA